MSFRGAWNPSGSYKDRVDVVTYNGGSYLKLGDGNSGSSPDADAIRWQSIGSTFNGVLNGIEDNATPVLDFFAAEPDNHVVRLQNDWTLKIHARAGGNHEGHLYLEAGGSGTRVQINGNGSNVQIVANDYVHNSQWDFNADGTLVTPNGLKFDLYQTISAAGQSIKIIPDYSGTSYIIVPPDGSGDALSISHTGSVVITAGGNRQWSFDGGSNLTFPDSTVQTTAYQTTTAPGSSKGVSGNKAGMVAFTNDFFYYCKEDYTNGVVDIWVRSAWTNSSW